MSKDSPLPSLSALRAFDAAARHGGFAKAAEALHVTPAALSFQIRALEQRLGLALFHRRNRAVTLTEAGAALAAHTAEGFAALRRGVAALERFREGTRLTLTAGPAFTGAWLAPRLFAFAAAHPDIELNLLASLRLVDLDAEPVDIAIRFGFSAPEALYAEDLLTERLTPLCAPALAARLRAPEDLRAASLLRDGSIDGIADSRGWAAWFAAAGLADPPTPSGPRFSSADHAVRAAVEGGGVLLGRSSLTRMEMASGRLVAPFDCALEPGARYRFLCAAGAQARPAVAAFRDWLKAEIAAAPEPMAGMRLVAPSLRP